MASARASVAGRSSASFDWRILLAVCTMAAVGAGILILTRDRFVAGLAALIAATALVLGVDAADAEGGERGLIAGRLVDRLFDAAILAPLAWVWRGAPTRTAGLALVAVAAAYLASYQRARGEALGYRGVESGVYRAARAGLLVAGLLTGWLEPLLWAAAGLTVAACVVRAWNVMLQDRRHPSPPAEPDP